LGGMFSEKPDPRCYGRLFVIKGTERLELAVTLAPNAERPPLNGIQAPLRLAKPLDMAQPEAEDPVSVLYNGAQVDGQILVCMGGPIRLHEQASLAESYDASALICAVKDEVLGPDSKIDVPCGWVRGEQGIELLSMGAGATKALLMPSAEFMEEERQRAEGFEEGFSKNAVLTALKEGEANLKAFAPALGEQQANRNGNKEAGKKENGQARNGHSTKASNSPPKNNKNSEDDVSEDDVSDSLFGAFSGLASDVFGGFHEDGKETKKAAAPPKKQSGPASQLERQPEPDAPNKQSGPASQPERQPEPDAPKKQSGPASQPEPDATAVAVADTAAASEGAAPSHSWGESRLIKMREKITATPDGPAREKMKRQLQKMEKTMKTGVGFVADADGNGKLSQEDIKDQFGDMAALAYVLCEAAEASSEDDDDNLLFKSDSSEEDN